MNANRTSLRLTLATALAAVLLSAAQFAGIDSLAAPQQRDAAPAVAQLPLVVVVGKRAQEAADAAAVRLPTVVVIGRAERALAKNTVEASSTI